MTGEKKMGRPLKFQTVEELESKIDEYFKSCWDYKRDMFGNRLIDKENPSHSKENPAYLMVQHKPYTITGLAVFLDTSRDTLLEYSEREDFADTIKRAKDAIYAYAEERLFSGGQAAGVIFNMKNNWGWKDKTEFEGTIHERPILGGKSVHRDDSDPEAAGDEEAS